MEVALLGEQTFDVKHVSVSKFISSASDALELQFHVIDKVLLFTKRNDTASGANPHPSFGQPDSLL